MTFDRVYAALIAATMPDSTEFTKQRCSMPQMRRQPRLRTLVLALALAGGLPYAVAKPAPAPTKVDIPYEQFTLPNGLRVVVHTDRKAPIVAVNVWYHVGSKDEPAGRSGFAHLFEHLMFQGSENHRGEYFEPFKQVGVTDQNGTTSTDRTNYFQNVPTTALDTALFMESDRMGHLLGAIDQAALDEQRGVVQNEKRQGENQPYGRSYDALVRALYPVGHPYHHTVIGSMNDLNAASLDDVKTWFRSWYGPNNAVLVLAGDIDLATAKTKVTKYFGDIPASATLPAKPPMVAARTSSTRDTMTDRVAQSRVMRIWNVPQYGSAEVEHLQLFAQILGGSRSSRLDKRLAFGDKTVDRISASMDASELGGTFDITADVKPGVDAAIVEKAINEELEKLLREGPTAAELEQARTVFKASFVRGIERIGGFGGKADALAECTVYTGNPGCFREQLARIESTTAAQITATANKWLRAGDHTLSVVPGEVTPIVEEPSVAAGKPAVVPPADPKFKTVASDVDRSKGVPLTNEFPDLKFPPLQRGRLSNGMKVILAERHDVPVVQMSMEFPGGFSSDQGRKAGTASFTMGMLDEGAGPYDAIALGNRSESLGAIIGSGASLDAAEVSLSALKEKLDDSMALYADVIRRPRFEPLEIERVRANWLSAIQQEKTQPAGMTQRVIAPLVYGAGHPYAIPLGGTGYEADIASLSRDELLAWHREQLRPDNATVMVVGDTTLAEITPLLEKHFGDWTAPAGARPAIQMPMLPLPAAPRVFLIDQPGAIQSNIVVAQLAPPVTDANAIEFDIANGVLGGDFTSRLNMNLREDKHWSYGARSSANSSIGQRLWAASAPVQSDKTIEAIKEVQREIADFASGKVSATPEEVARIQAINVRTLPGSFETGRAVLGTVQGINRFGRPDDYVVQRKARIEAMTPASVQEAAKTIQPQAMTWVIVGDLGKIEAGIRALDIGPVQVIDADGKPVPVKTAK
jgi:predicted Zn-dependent peptidase